MPKKQQQQRTKKPATTNHDEYLFALEHQRKALQKIEELQQEQQKQKCTSSSSSTTVICQVCFEEKYTNTNTIIQNHNNNNNNNNTNHNNNKNSNEILYCNNNNTQQQQQQHPICYDCILSYMQEWLYENEDHTAINDDDTNDNDNEEDDWMTTVICKIPCFCNTINCNSYLIVSNWTNIMLNSDVQTLWKLLTKQQQTNTSSTSYSCVSLLVPYIPSTTTTETTTTILNNNNPANEQQQQQQQQQDDDNDNNSDNNSITNDELLAMELREHEFNSLSQQINTEFKERNCPNCFTILKKVYDTTSEEEQDEVATGDNNKLNLLGCNAILCTFCETSVCYCCEMKLDTDDNHFLMNVTNYNKIKECKCPFYTTYEDDTKEDQLLINQEILRLSQQLFNID